MDPLLDSAPCGFLVFGDDGVIVQANVTLGTLLGYDAGELFGRTVNLLLSVAGRVFYQSYFFPLLKLEGRADEIYLSLRTRAGADLPVLVNAVRTPAEGGPLNHCVLVPIRRRSRFEDELIRARKTAEAALQARDQANRALIQAHAELQARQAELEALNARLAVLATVDALTGLANRGAFEERLIAELADAQRHGRPLGVLLADVDHFKAVNDTHGHQAGDAVLRAVGKMLAGGIRERDVAARFGGEEFAVVLPSTDLYGALEAAERLRAAIEVARPAGIAVTISVGVAAADDARPRAAHDLLAAADRALYRSKDEGRNRVSAETSAPGLRYLYQ
jgi:diguanylate cyclase (GGDEF)-like protein/PAS domain S-box-containing protein